MVLCFELWVGVVSDGVVDGLLDGLVVLETDLRVAHDAGSDPARLGAHGSTISWTTERKCILKQRKRKSPSLSILDYIVIMAQSLDIYEHNKATEAKEKTAWRLKNSTTNITLDSKQLGRLSTFYPGVWYWLCTVLNQTQVRKHTP